LRRLYEKTYHFIGIIAPLYQFIKENKEFAFVWSVSNDRKSCRAGDMNECMGNTSFFLELVGFTG
jgi:hypothetical protein